jgi:hypothetical protein
MQARKLSHEFFNSYNEIAIYGDNATVSEVNGNPIFNVCTLELLGVISFTC